MACRTGCLTGGHQSWGECARAANFQIDRHALKTNSRVEKDKDARLGRYEDARRQGLNPKSTEWKDVRNAFENGTADTVKSLSPDYVPPTAVTPTPTLTGS